MRSLAVVGCLRRTGAITKFTTNVVLWICDMPAKHRQIFDYSLNGNGIWTAFLWRRESKKNKEKYRAEWRKRRAERGFQFRGMSGQSFFFFNFHNGQQSCSQTTLIAREWDVKTNRTQTNIPFKQVTNGGQFQGSAMNQHIWREIHLNARSLQWISPILMPREESNFYRAQNRDGLINRKKSIRANWHLFGTTKNNSSSKSTLMEPSIFPIYLSRSISIVAFEMLARATRINSLYQRVKWCSICMASSWALENFNKAAHSIKRCRSKLNCEILHESWPSAVRSSRSPNKTKCNQWHCITRQ